LGIIEVKSVYKVYFNLKGDTGRIVLKDVSLSIEANEFVCLIGPSGCGKTTLLNLIAGFEKPTRGELFFKDRQIFAPSSERAVVFQEYSLFPWMNVLKNVEFSLDRNNLSSKERSEVAMKYLDLVGLSEHWNHRPNLLSGGMKQRVAIARTLAMQPEVILMDEPFSNLDEQTKSDLDEEILEIWKKDRRTVVFVTHSIDEALLLGTRIMMFSSSPGRIVGEWRLDVKTRDIMSTEMLRLKREILEKLRSARSSKIGRRI